MAHTSTCHLAPIADSHGASLAFFLLEALWEVVFSGAVGAEDVTAETTIMGVVGFERILAM